MARTPDMLVGVHTHLDLLVVTRERSLPVQSPAITVGSHSVPLSFAKSLSEFTLNPLGNTLEIKTCGWQMLANNSISTTCRPRSQLANRDQLHALGYRELALACLISVSC